MLSPVSLTENVIKGLFWISKIRFPGLWVSVVTLNDNMGFYPHILATIGRRMLASSFKNHRYCISTTALRWEEKKEQKNPTEDVCEEQVIFKTLSGGKAVIQLNRPKQLNTLNFRMVCEIRQKLLEWKDDKYFILIKGSGEKAFCAGGDVVAVTKDTTGEVCKRFFREEYKLDALISSLSIPFCSLLNGIVMGGGVGISIFGKPRIATEKSLFAMPETHIGFFPDVGVSFHLARMPKNLGMFLALTGYRLNGYDLVHAEIATHFVRSEHINALEKGLLCDFFQSCCKCPNDTIREYMEKSLQGFPNGQPPPFTLQEHLKSIECWFSPCTLEEAVKKIETENSKFAKDTLACLKKMSPLSLKVTYKQIKDAANMNIYECFNMDYRISRKMMHCGDFVEGVRALLIDKDKKPKWKHEDISKVTAEEVNEFFCPLSPEEELNLPDSLCECECCEE